MAIFRVVCIHCAHSFASITESLLAGRGRCFAKSARDFGGALGENVAFAIACAQAAIVPARRNLARGSP
jgi:hypothetical protein